jgi:hypothetical protein
MPGKNFFSSQLLPAAGDEITNDLCLIMQMLDADA